MPEPPAPPLTAFPDRESAAAEFKSSLTSFAEFGKKLSKAASGFANTGGGVFVMGVDDHGDADGGVETVVGRQALSDWIDVVVHQVLPTPRYRTHLLTEADGRGRIEPGRVVAVVEFFESAQVPHMADDERYYIRAGAHTVPAGQFLVDALYAKRGVGKPVLAHAFRMKPGFPGTVQLGVMTLSEAPAVQVRIDLSNTAAHFKSVEKHLPLAIPVIGSSTPFFMDVATFHDADERFGTDVRLSVDYQDLEGHDYHYVARLNISDSLPPLSIGTESNEKAAKALEKIERTLRSLLKHVDSGSSSDPTPSTTPPAPPSDA
ncbi:AlbA family DNA-binding domain-containing protein [Alienimonas californiensis]|uniref:Divergent AAA domain protein n=1 Tax=Alienimonas californiensis TaxID=2527989 RepID=A0A517P5X6_9PLAN|nr:ATP-binding protein [Alienimonas californiensis]QDT14773.1 Divergent AAA domain protein [Alienimonas californiensis]